MTKARDIADIASNLSANASKAVVVNAGGTELTFGDAGSSDLYDESFVGKRGLTFTVDATGTLNVTV